MLPTQDHFISIYKTSPAAYHALIAAEDTDGNLLPALQSIAPLAGKRILDLGSGTGRFPLLLRNLECSIIALDLHRAMLLEQAHSSSLRGVEAKPRRRSNPQDTINKANIAVLSGSEASSMRCAVGQAAQNALFSRGLCPRTPIGGQLHVPQTPFA